MNAVKNRNATHALAPRLRSMAFILKTSWQLRRGAVLSYAAGAILETTSFLVSLYASAQIAGLLANYSHGQASGRIWLWLGIDIAGAIGISVGFWMMTINKRLLYFRIVRWATSQFQSTLCRIDIPDFYDESIRNKINKAQGGYTWQLSNFAEATLDLIYAVFRFLATAAVVSQITWWLIPLIALFLIPSLLAEARLAKVQWFVWDEEGDTRHVFWGLEWIIRQVKQQMELRSTQAQQYILGRIDGLNRSFYTRQERQFKRVNRMALPAKVIEIGGTAVGSVVLLRQFLGGAILLERYFFLSGALLRITSSLNNIFGTLSRLQEQFLFVENYLELISRRPTYTDKPHAIQLSTDKAPEITFDNVSFTYPGQDKPVFQNLSVTIPSGTHVALVGENGAGKSTLIKLLLRFYKPTEGRILINGHDLEDIAIESWYDHLATLFQEFNHYPFPVAENIEIGRPRHKGDHQRLQSAADFSGVNTFVGKYEHGWDTSLGEGFTKGTEPSGGQWQRIALARAFYRQASVLILDEPTAAIDAKAEFDIFNNIFDHYKDKTAIIVSHRFSTVRRAHKIIVIDNGKILEQGSHLELMKQKGLYHELFTKQAEGYKE